MAVTALKFAAKAGTALARPHDGGNSPFAQSSGFDATNARRRDCRRLHRDGRLARGVFYSDALAANLEPSRQVYVADSFEGLPPPNPDSFPVDEGSCTL